MNRKMSYRFFFQEIHILSAYQLIDGLTTNLTLLCLQTIFIIYLFQLQKLFWFFINYFCIRRYIL